MASIQLDQQGSAWLAWRSKGIGASDAPIIMGDSPWKTELDLYFSKISPDAGKRETNWAQQRGIDLEPKARAAYELMNSMDMPAVLMESEEYPFMRASLDGYNAEFGVVLEIKCPGKEDYLTAKAGKVPLKYQWQLEHQLFVTKAKRADYFTYYVDPKTKKEDYVLVTYMSDPVKQKQMIEAILKFWNCVQTKTPPKMSDRDVMTLEKPDDIELYSKIALAKVEYDALATQADAAKDKLDALKETATRTMPHDKVRCAGIEISKVLRRGSVDYDKVPHLVNVDLEQYRKTTIVSYSVKLVGKEGSAA